MTKFKKILTALCLGLFVSIIGIKTVDAEDKIILFDENTSAVEFKNNIKNLEKNGVVILASFQFINGVLIEVPETTSADSLINSVITETAFTIESDMLTATPILLENSEILLNIDTTTIEIDTPLLVTASADGGATSFIEPVPKPEPGYRPWGLLYEYGHTYDPEEDLGYLDLSDVSIKIISALTNVKSIKLAIFDTGIDYTHPAISEYVAGGADFVNFASGIPMDDNGHGSHVAGSLTARELGVSYTVQLYAVKVLDENAGGNLSSLIMGFQWAIDNNMDIINMSLAFADDSEALKRAVRKINELGIVMVAAVGNHSNWDGGAADGGAADGGAADGGAADGGAADDGTGDTNTYPVMYPAAYPEVIAVGAMDSFGAIASFSNDGPERDILAPGTNIISTDMGGGYGRCSGTSMAAPYVSGAVAMLLAADRTLNVLQPSLTPEELKSLLKSTAIDGKLNFPEALNSIFLKTVLKIADKLNIELTTLDIMFK